MAVLFSITDGNINATASWGVVEPTSFQGTPNVATSTTLGATLNTGTAFTLASATTVAGVALQLSGRVTSPTGTYNVQLYDVTGATIIAQVTVNISDLPNSNAAGAQHIDWVYFKFSSPVTTIAGRSYAIRAQASITTQLSWYYTTAITNVNRALVTTTNQAPVASDQLIIAGSYTSAGVSSTTTITMNYNSSNYVQIGNIWVSSKGIFTFATSISSYIPIAGYIVVGVGGTFNIGTSLAPITGNAQMQMLCTTALQYPIWVYGTMTTYGTTKTVGVKLVSDVIVGSTNSTISSIPTNWSNFDNLLVPSTTRTYTQYEVVQLSSNVASTSISHSTYINAHGGNTTTLVQADIVNLTRNILITGNGAPFANKTNIQMFANSITSFYYTTFSGMGTGITVANSGICVNILNTGYTFDMQYCVISDGTQAAANTANTALFNLNSIGTTISNNIFYSLGWTSNTTTINVYNFDNGNYIIGCLATNQVLLATNIGSNNVYSSNNTPATIGFLSNSTNNSFYSNNTSGINISNPIFVNATLSNYKIWRNNTYGIVFTFTGGYNKSTILTFDGLYCFGNTIGTLVTNSRQHIKVYFSNSFFYGGTTLVQPNHFIGTGNIVDSFYYNNCYFGYSDSSLTSSPFSGAILQVPVPNVTKIFNNCYFNGTEISGTTGYPSVNMTGSFMSLNHNGVTASHKQWFSNGIISTDLVIYYSSTKSLRLTPNNAVYKLNTPLVKVPVKIATTCTITVKIRRSIAGDGATYNGATPRLMYAFNPVLGNNTETVGHAPIGFVVGQWETLTYTTGTFSNDGVAEFYVDCDGTTGWINVDDWDVTTSVDSRANDYWGVNATYVEPDFKRGTRSYTFVK